MCVCSCVPFLIFYASQCDDDGSLFLYIYIYVLALLLCACWTRRDMRVCYDDVCAACASPYNFRLVRRRLGVRFPHFFPLYWFSCAELFATAPYYCHVPMTCLPICHTCAHRTTGSILYLLGSVVLSHSLGA